MTSEKIQERYKELNKKANQIAEERERAEKILERISRKEKAAEEAIERLQDHCQHKSLKGEYGTCPDCQKYCPDCGLLD